MAKQNEHGKLIAAAAKAALAPLGFRRVGQSRTWISDERYWAIWIEFQPSAWSKGSYLNVRPSWLWLRYGGNDDHPRPADFIPFENTEQFTPLIKDMAAIAAQTAVAMRDRFRTLEDVHRFFSERVSQDGFPVYRAAITAGLVGDLKAARPLFERMENIDMANWGPWILKLKTECAELAALLDDPVRYKAAILETITDRREKIRLPPDPQCLESTGSTVVG
ncbi:hypothetical protein [Undibacter mobilis]|uniref:DUF4304 domain-containing protein n=1 Tax=Undibacter mobilis TaxID=2292256 RepID=A0A371BB97_9BRAD|nr:hypothetical protein [Undibacter mobilis]RDV04844.1 hypothetical protein DXH78_09880 [Undibacter mobilis]